MRFCHGVYAYDMLMLEIKKMLGLKNEQLFANSTKIGWLGCPYARIILESCHNIKLAADKEKDDVQRQQPKAANGGRKMKAANKGKQKSR